MAEQRASSHDLSPGLRGFLNLIDNSRTTEEIQQIPRSWVEDDNMTIDQMWERYQSKLKTRLLDSENSAEALTFTPAMAERETQSRRGVISKWLKKPARKFWKTIREIFKRER